MTKEEKNYQAFGKTISNLERDYCLLHRKDLLFDKLNFNLKDQLPPNYLKESDKESLFDIYSNLLTTFSYSEKIIKSYLAELFITQTTNNIAFEMRCLNSRIDFISFNDKFTYGFEIKSKHDGLSRLEKQIYCYTKIFNYNYLIVDESHLGSILKIDDESIGIVIFEKVNGENGLVTVREPKFFQPKSQDLLELFNKNELRRFFKDINLDNILAGNGDSIIRQNFLDLLFYRYGDKNSFLKSKINEIYNLDYQYFFKNNIEPELIYN